MSFARTLVTIAGIAWLAGCAGIQTSPGEGEMRKLLTPDRPDIAYEKALQAVIHQGGAIQFTKTPKFISARFFNGVTLSVIVTPHEQGTKVEAFAKLDAGKIAFGGITIADNVLAQYQKETL